MRQIGHLLNSRILCYAESVKKNHMILMSSPLNNGRTNLPEFLGATVKYQAPEDDTKQVPY